MTVKLTVDSRRWHRHVSDVASAVDGLVAVVKGNGYGFGRVDLARRALEYTDTIAVGTVHELDGLPAEATVVVLTPTLTPPVDARPILTVGAPEHVDVLTGWRGRVVVKLESSMRRFGRGTELIDASRAAGLEVEGVSIHPPIAGNADAHAADIERWLSSVPTDLTVWVSHLSPERYAALPPSHSYLLRLGTTLWHGDKADLQLSTDVLDTKAVRAGERVGYRSTPVAADATLLTLGAGSAHGVAPLPDGRSPFHFDRRRLTLLEPPHMHTSLVVVPRGQPAPAIGDWVDVQRPLITTSPDLIEWT